MNAADTTLFEYPMDTIADVSETVSFSCSASGVPLPDISWYKDGYLLDTSSNNITDSANETSVTSVLVLSDLILSDAGLYICNASHPVSGTDTREFTFTIQSKHFPLGK